MHILPASSSSVYSCSRLQARWWHSNQVFTKLSWIANMLNHKFFKICFLIHTTPQRRVCNLTAKKTIFLPYSPRTQVKLLLSRLTGCDIWSDQRWLSADSPQQELRERPVSHRQKKVSSTGHLATRWHSTEERREEKSILHCRIFNLKACLALYKNGLQLRHDDSLWWWNDCTAWKEI